MLGSMPWLLAFAGVIVSSSACRTPLRVDPEPRSPTGDQLVAGWFGSVLVGMIAWRAFDDPFGPHARVIDDWAYTPRAMTAMAAGSFVGATLGIWGRGRHNGSSGSLAATAAGVGLGSIPMFLRRNDPLFPLMVVTGWAPVQAFVGYTGYRMSSSASPGNPRPAPPVRALPARPTRSADLIVADELATSAARNVYDAISQLRPQWLSAARLRSPVEFEAAGEAGILIVYVDGVRYGPIEALRQLSLRGVTECRYYNARDATLRFGTGHPAGAIDVRLARSQ